MKFISPKWLKKPLVIAAIIGAVIIIAAALSAFFVYRNGLGPADIDDDTPITVDIPQNSGALQIIDILDENGLIKNRTAARIHVRLGNYDTLQANTYIFSKDMDLKEILTAINTGDFNYLSKNQLTVVEGSTIPTVAQAIEDKFAISSDELIALWSDADYLAGLIDEYWFLTDEILQDGIMYPLEGYLYPETYTITDQDINAEAITEIILDYTGSVLSQRMEEIEGMGMTIHEFLSLASVVESESLYEEDMPKIAGVFMNRLETGMLLQSDITVLYALQEKRVNVTYEDLEVDSPYNTYIYAGLPIGPVCCVSSTVMDATLNYEDSDYLYFFATEDGTVIYSKTLAEHEQAISENLWY